MTTAATNTRRRGLAATAAGLLLTGLASGVTAAPAAADLAPTGPTSASADRTQIARGGSTEVTVEVTGTTTSASTPTDVMLMLDESGSMTSAQFLQMKTFARELVVDLGAAGLFTDNGGRFGLGMFSSTARTVLPLSNGSTQVAAVNAVNSLQQYGGYTCLTCAVERATLDFASSAEGRKRVLVLLTDGAGNRRTTELAAKVAAAQAAGIETFVVGVGTAVSLPEIHLIASDPDSDHVFTTATFEQLSTIVSALAGAVDAPAAHDAQVTVQVPAPFTPSDATTTHGTAVVTDDTVTWDLGTLGDETATLTWTATHDGSTDCGAALPVQTAGYTDAEGTTGVSFPAVTVDVTGCPAAMTLTPETSSPTTDGTQSLSATVVDDFGTPVAGEPVTFSVTGGPNAGDEQTVATVSDGTAVATFSGSGVGQDTVQVSAEDVIRTATIDWQSPWPWSGFQRPVDDAPAVNVVKAGSAVPVRFSLGGDRGLDIFAAGSPSSVTTSCEDGTETGTPLPASTVGGGLSYDAASDTYSFVWKTEKGWTGCRTLTLRFVNGMTETAVFRMR